MAGGCAPLQVPCKYFLLPHRSPPLFCQFPPCNRKKSLLLFFVGLCQSPPSVLQFSLYQSPIFSRLLCQSSFFSTSNGATYRGGSPSACTLHAVAPSLNLQRRALHNSGVGKVQARCRFQLILGR